MTVNSTSSSARSASPALNIGLWIAQVLIFAAFVLFGYMKLFMPISELAAMWHWPGEVPVPFVRFMGIVDTAGGIGVLLPALTRIKPRLTVLAALGCSTVQVFAIIFHLARGEGMVTPFNAVLLALSVFILWGRAKKAPILPRA